MIKNYVNHNSCGLIEHGNRWQIMWWIIHIITKLLQIKTFGYGFPVRSRRLYKIPTKFQITSPDHISLVTLTEDGRIITDVTKPGSMPAFLIQFHDIFVPSTGHAIVTDGKRYYDADDIVYMLDNMALAVSMNLDVDRCRAKSIIADPMREIPRVDVERTIHLFTRNLL